MKEQEEIRLITRKRKKKTIRQTSQKKYNYKSNKNKTKNLKRLKTLMNKNQMCKNNKNNIYNKKKKITPN